MDQDLYQEQLIEEARQPRNQGQMDNPDVTVTEFNASCGDKVTLFLKFSPDGKTITDLSWQGSGCIISQAAASLLSDEVKGKKLTDLASLELADVLALLDLKEISPGRIKCATLALTALKQAIVTTPSSLAPDKVV